MQEKRKRGNSSAFHCTEKPVVPVNNQLEWSFPRKKGKPSEVFLFLVFTGMLRISLYHFSFCIITMRLDEIRGFHGGTGVSTGKFSNGTHSSRTIVFC